MTTVMAVCWRHCTILNSYSPQMEQREPEKRMLICLENAIYLLNVAPSNPLPHPLSPPPISLQFKDFIQHSRMLHALYRKKMAPNRRIAKHTTAISIWALLLSPLSSCYVSLGGFFHLILLHTWHCSGSNVMTLGSPRQQLKRC